jgi:hypothetical protein
MQLNPNAHAISGTKIIEPGIENAILRYEVVKRDGKFLIDLVKHWVIQHHDRGGTITENHRVVMSTLDLCMQQNTRDAARPDNVGGTVGRCKDLATRTGIPMTVSLPN